MAGKWSNTDIPKVGWACINITDLGEPSEICAMCETQVIRYVHTMEHLDYPERLNCGCICAGHMEDDEIGAKLREANCKREGARRQKWLNRKWRSSRGGNPYINVDGYNIVVYQVGNVWGFRIQCCDTSREIIARRLLNTKEDAMLRSFDAMLWMEEKRRVT